MILTHFTDRKIPEANLSHYVPAQGFFHWPSKSQFVGAVLEGNILPPKLQRALNLPFLLTSLTFPYIRFVKLYPA